MSWLFPTAEEKIRDKAILDELFAPMRLKVKAARTNQVLKQLANRQYAVLESMYVDDLVEYVNIAIELGYRPVGGMATTFSTVKQPVEKI